MITSAQRRQGRIGLAMLPLGAVLVLASAIGVVSVLVLALSEVVTRGPGWGWYVGWCLLAAVIGVRNLVRSLQTMSALDVGGTFITIMLSAAIVATYPGWWLT